MLPAPPLSFGRAMNVSAVLCENVVRPAGHHAPIENGVNRCHAVHDRETKLLQDVLNVVLGVDRRLLRDDVQLVQSLVGQHTTHHQFWREYHVEDL